MNEHIDYQVEKFTSYALHRNLKNKRSCRDSGGIIVYISDRISEKVSLLKSVEDGYLWLKFDRELFDLDEHLILCLCYNVPTGSSRQALVNQSIFDCITEDLAFFESKYNS